MNKEKFMQLAEKAFDEGAMVKFNFSHYKKDFSPVSEQEARETALLAKEAFGGTLTLKESGICDSYEVNDIKDCQYFFASSFKKEVKPNVG
jgi:hypothetical protein